MTAAPGFAVVTGASTGIGRELARIAVEDGHTVLAVADEAEIEATAAELSNGVTVEPMKADLATDAGRRKLLDRIAGQHLDYFFANAGIGLGGAFLDQDLGAIRRVIDTNVMGTTIVLHEVIRQMRAVNAGRILITGSIAGMMPGSYQAVYNATKAYLDNLSWALRNENNDTAITITCLMPGPTDTDFFERGDLKGTPVGDSDDKADPAKVARAGYDAMMRGASGATPGFMNKMSSALAGIVPDRVMAEVHRRMAEPKSDTSD